MEGLITAAKDVLTSCIIAAIPNATVVRSRAEENKQVMARKWPLVSLITQRGSLDDRTAKLIRYVDEKTNERKQRRVRGTRIVPILISVWSCGEKETDEAFSKIVPRIPRKWEYDDFRGSILINSEEHSDFADNVSNVYCSILEVQFQVEVAGDAELVPSFDTVTGSPEMEKV